MYTLQQREMYIRKLSRRLRGSDSRRVGKTLFHFLLTIEATKKNGSVAFRDNDNDNYL